MQQMTIYEFFENNKKVTIPVIQRDYAQGRIDKGYIREAFLKNIYDGVKCNEECLIPMDFVYGYKDEEGVFYPLDGQQRLTTLWLIYWYLAVRAHELEEKGTILSRFSYETRVSTREFCEELCNPDNMVNYPGGDITAFIVDQHWFSTEWQDDPTVSSMLRTLGGDSDNDGIHPVFMDGNKWRTINTWRDFLKRFEKRVILFEYKIGGGKLPEESADQLYIKMNARGRALSDFEDFRADLIDQLEKVCSERRKKRPLYTNEEVIAISECIDYSWNGIFWNDINGYIDKLEKSKNAEKKQIDYDHKAAVNLKDGIGRNTDELFFSFINRFCFGQLCVSKIENKNEDKYRLDTSLISLIDALQDPDEEKYLSETKQRKIAKLREQSIKNKQKIESLNQYDYFFHDYEISYEKYDYYKDILPFNGNKNCFGNIQNVLNALCEKVSNDDDKTITWAEFIQIALEEYVNKRVKIRQPNSEGYCFLPKYRREIIKDDSEENRVVSWKGNVLTRLNKGGISVGQIEGIKLADRIYFFAICKYLDVNYANLDKDSFIDWLRFCRNVIENASISSVAAMITCIRVLDKYGKHSRDIIEFLYSVAKEQGEEKGKRKNSNDVGFEPIDFEKMSYLNAQIAEEVLKSQKIYESDCWKVKIRGAEDYSCFCGCIRFLFLDSKFNEKWSVFIPKFERSKEIFLENENSVDYDCVKEYALQFKDFEAVSDKLIFHRKGWSERGDSWVNVLCDYNRRELNDKWLMGKPDELAQSQYKAFLDSDAFISIVKKKGILKEKVDLHITKRGERWICVQKSSEYDYLIFDDGSFKRNENLEKWINEGKIKLVSGILPFNENPNIHIGGGYYWYRDICFRYKGKIYQYSSDMRFFELDEKTGKSKISSCPI